MQDLQELLFRSIDEKVQILIGDEIGFSEISGCSLMLSGIEEDNIRLAFGVLGPMRMRYLKAASCLYSVRNQLVEVLAGLEI